MRRPRLVEPMSEPSTAPPSLAESELEGLYGLTDELARRVSAAIEAGRATEIATLAEPLHAADLADLFEHLGSSDRLAFVAALGERLDPEFVSYVDPSVREELVKLFDTEQLAQVVVDLESDDALDLIEDLKAAEQRDVLAAIPADQRVLYEEALSYPKDSAGRLMRRDVAAVPSILTVGDTIDYMRSDSVLPGDFYDLVVVGPAHKPLGMVPLSRLLQTKRPIKIIDIMGEEMKLLPVTMDQEDVAFLFRQYGLVEAPVVDDADRLVGIITVDDVVDVIEEEHEDDMLKLGGVVEDDIYSAVIKTTRSRFSWLLVNLATAILASIVIAIFDHAIERVVALAILMPIVASMGGNAGTQTLTVAVRALATKELTASNAMRIVGKEVLVGCVNGIVFAVIIGAIAWFWFGDPQLGGVIALAMIINLLVASFAGILIPLGFERAGTDPAVASVVLLTTVTDVLGFFIFLGLAALVLL